MYGQYITVNMGNAPSSAVPQMRVAAVNGVYSVDENLQRIKRIANLLYGRTSKISVVRDMDKIVRILKRTTARRAYPTALNLLADFLEETYKNGTLYHRLYTEFDPILEDFGKNAIPDCRIATA